MYPPSLAEVSPAPRRLRQVTVGLSLVVALWKTEAMLVAFSVAPSGVPTAGPAPHDASVHDAVAEAVRVVRESGLPNRTDAMFTTIEGEWDEVMAVVKAATDAVAASAPRVSLVLKADIRPGFTDMLTAKIASVERHLEV